MLPLRVWICLLLLLAGCFAQAQPAALGPARWAWARAFGYPATEYLGPDPEITAMVSDTMAKKVYVGFLSAPYIAWSLDTYTAGSVEASDFRFDSVWAGVACFSESGKMEWVYALAGDTINGGPMEPTRVSGLAQDPATGTLLVNGQANGPGVFLSDSSYRYHQGHRQQVRPPRGGYPLTKNATFVLALEAQTGRMRWVREGNLIQPTPFDYTGTGWHSLCSGPAGSFYLMGSTTDQAAYFGGEPGLPGAPAGWISTTGTGPAIVPVVLRVDARTGQVRAARSFAANAATLANIEYQVAHLLPFGQEGLCFPVSLWGRFVASPGDTLSWDPNIPSQSAHALLFLDTALQTQSRLMFDGQRSFVYNVCPSPEGGVLARVRYGYANTTLNGGQLTLPAGPQQRPRFALLEVPPSGAAGTRLRWWFEPGPNGYYEAYSMLAGPDGGLFLGGANGSSELGQTQWWAKRAIPLAGTDSSGKIVWGLVGDTALPMAMRLAWASGRRMWIGGSIGQKRFPNPFILTRGHLWPHRLSYTGGQNFLGLSEPLPPLSPLVATKPALGLAVPLHLYPNPARRQTTLSGPAHAWAELMDLQGRRLASFRLDQEGRATVDLKDCRPGLYFIRCRQQTLKLAAE